MEEVRHLVDDQIIEWANDNGEIDEAMSEQFADAAASQAVVEWTDCLRNLIAADVTYRMACGELGTHRLRRHDDGTLTLDGEVLVQ